MFFFGCEGIHLYLEVVCQTPIESDFLFDVLKYTKSVGGFTKTTEELTTRIKNKIYFMKPKDFSIRLLGN